MIFKTRRGMRNALRLVALLLGLSAALVAEILIEEKEYWTAVKVSALVIAAAVLEFLFADVIADSLSYPRATEQRLKRMEKKLGARTIEKIQTRLTSVVSEFKGCDCTRISATVHLVTDLVGTTEHRDRRGLLQLTDYIGPAKGKKGRITLINQGIIGRCARTGIMESVDFADEDEYERAMVREFGFTSEETAKHTKTARSYLAYPLKTAERIVGTIYFFSTEPQVFPRAVDESRLAELAKEFVNYLDLAELA